MRCRICSDERLWTFLSLGNSPLANRFLKAEDLNMDEPRFPLELALCWKCKLVQLTHVVDPKVLFSHYLYVSSTTQSFRKHFSGMAGHLKEVLALDESSLAVDIGSNDGILLRGFREHGVKAIGVEPAGNLAELANDEGLETEHAFFSPEVAQGIIGRKGKAAVVTACNVFAHIDDVHAVLKGVDALLAEKGAFVVEFQYFVDTVETMTFDNVYHEHLSYFTLTSLQHLLARHMMELFRAEHVDTHGGSIRAFICRKGERPIDPSVERFVSRERSLGVGGKDWYGAFAGKVAGVKFRLVRELDRLKKQGKRIAGYGAPAKSSTLLNYCGIDGNTVEYIVEDNPLKVGLLTPGTHIHVVGPAELEKARPDYLLVLAWNFSREIMEKTRAHADAGMRYIIPLPEVRIVGGKTQDGTQGLNEPGQSEAHMGNEIVKKIEPAFQDERGVIANILDEPVSHVAIITSKKGAVRANHYHPVQVQYEYLVSGSYESVTKDLKKDTPVERRIIEAGSLVITPPMIAHAMRFLEDSVMLNITTGARDSKDYAEHTKQYKLV